MLAWRHAPYSVQGCKWQHCNTNNTQQTLLVQGCKWQHCNTSNTEQQCPDFRSQCRLMGCFVCQVRMISSTSPEGGPACFLCAGWRGALTLLAAPSEFILGFEKGNADNTQACGDSGHRGTSGLSCFQAQGNITQWKLPSPVHVLF